MATIGTTGRVVREDDAEERREGVWVLTTRGGEKWLVPQAELEIEDAATDVIALPIPSDEETTSRE